jgi:hypothetical protein
MSATPDNTLANPERPLADLQRQLTECKAARDEALQQQTSTSECLPDPRVSAVAATSSRKYARRVHLMRSFAG